jgi:hypothetical protein
MMMPVYPPPPFMDPRIMMSSYASPYPVGAVYPSLMPHPLPGGYYPTPSYPPAPPMIGPGRHGLFHQPPSATGTAIPTPASGTRNKHGARKGGTLN